METNVEKKVVRREPFDLIGFFHFLLKRWFILFVCMILGAVFMALYANTNVVPLFESKAMIFVAKTGTIDSLEDLQKSSSMTDDYIIIAKSYPVLDTVIQRLYAEDGVALTRTQALNSVSVSDMDNSHIIQFKVNYEDPKIACDLCNILTDVMVDQIAYIMSTDKPTIVQRAEVSTNPTNAISIGRETVIGAIVGLGLCLAVLYVMFELDDKVKNSSDVEKYFGDVPVIISIPMDKNKNYKHKRKHKS